MTFLLLDTSNELVLVRQIEYVIKDLQRSMVAIILNISTCKAKSWCINVNKI